MSDPTPSHRPRRTRRAHKIDVSHTCPRCGLVAKRADWLVRNSRNAEMGYYCEQHADEEVERLNRDV